MLGLPYSCIPAMIDETPQPGLAPRQAAEDIALRKVAEVVSRDCHSPPWIFGADTIVVLEGRIFGKPKDRGDAQSMLEQLAGRQHEVITAMALYNGRQKTTDCRSTATRVTFARLTGEEIEWYLDTGEWEGVAGSYRLQEAGGCLIESINGSPSGVAGLPLHDFFVMLKDNGYPLYFPSSALMMRLREGG